MRLKSFDNILIGTMSFSALMSLYMLYGAKYFSKTSAPEVKVASIVEQIKTVKRKRDFYQSWVDVGTGDGLSQNDEIYTHGQSSAKINFVNGPEINLFENSLLKIKAKGSGDTLSLDRGNLTAKLTPKSSKLDIVLNGKKYSFESKNANIQIEQGKTENKFLLLDGLALLNIGHKSQMIATNQVLIQNKKTGDVKIKELPFVMKSPAHNLVTYFVREKELEFHWSNTNLSRPAPVKITIAKNSSFSEIIRSETIDSERLSMTFDNEGTYYWKLTSKDELDGPIRSFTLKAERPLNLYLDKTIIYKGPKVGEVVFISWPKDNSKNYELKIEHPNKQSEIIELSNNHYELRALEIGNYDISVKAKDVNRPDALWSVPSTLEVIEAKAISITSNMPESIEKVNYNNQSLSHLLSWSGPSSGVTYTVTLTKDKTVKTFKTENTTIPISLTGSGEYVWEIFGQTDSGVLSNGLKGKILLRDPLRLAQTPAEGAVIELDKPDQLVSFKWDRVENSEYQFELSNDSSFQKIIYEKNIETNNVSTTLGQTGRYFWRVKIKKGNAVEYSNPVSVEIKPTPPLSRPEIGPSIKIKIKYLDDRTSEFHFIDLLMARAKADDPIAVLEWDLPANSKAKNYIVEIYEDQDLKKLITRIETSVPHVIWKKAKLGTFFWRVSYVDYWGRKTEFSKVSTLEAVVDPADIKQEPPKVVEKLPPSPIDLATPRHHEEILNERDDEYKFTWSPLPDALTYQLSIARDLEFEKTIMTTKINGTVIKIQCKDLDNTEGDYYWKVTTDKGNISKRRMFHATCAPKKVEEPIAQQEIVPVPEIKSEIVPETKRIRFARIGFFPHHLTYQNRASQYSAKVSGNVLDSWYGTYQFPVEWRYFHSFSTSLFISRGKVFQSITFTDGELNFKAFVNNGEIESGFSWGPVIAFMKKTLYVEESLAINSANQSSPLLGFFVQKNMDLVSLNAEAKFGGTLDLHADALFYVKKNISVGPFFNLTTLTKEANRHSFSRLGMNLNYTFPLLETTK
ncbi:MAG: hypothetical protein ACXVLQ_04535 [Bacteriovorax sp.]